MLLVDLLGWWYSRGWIWAIKRVFVNQTESISGFFSITDLLKTLFAPFRQDAMNVKGAPLGIRLQVWGGNIVSRFFGLIIRSVLILAGLVALLINAVIGVFATILWPLLPLSPVIAVILILQGVGIP